MKIRSGFVSNSSSSSFIIKLEKDIKDYSFDEFFDLLSEGYVPSAEYSGATGEQLAKILFDDLNNPDASKLSTWMEEDLGHSLGEYQYHVEYEDHGEFGCDMEHYFMPYINIVEARYSHH